MGHVPCSRLPGVGIYIHMMERVSVSIIRFFATYVWHFLGSGRPISLYCRLGMDPSVQILVEYSTNIQLLELAPYSTKLNKNCTKIF